MDYFEEAIKNLKHQDQYNAYIERGICYRDTNLIDNSINDFLKALEIKKDDPFANFHLGINYLMNFNYESALEKLSAAIELNKFEPQFYNYKGLALFMSGQYEVCLGVYHEALKFYE
jgi:tetratricopeptide (TPR) repeat protein